MASAHLVLMADARRARRATLPRPVRRRSSWRRRTASSGRLTEVLFEPARRRAAACRPVARRARAAQPGLRRLAPGHAVRGPPRSPPTEVADLMLAASPERTVADAAPTRCAPTCAPTAPGSAAVVVLQFVGVRGDALPAQPERRHHRQRRGHRRHRLHRAHRRRDARRLAACRSSARSRRSGSARARRWASAATSAPRCSTGSGTLLAARGAALRGAVADHPRHQRRPAGADAGADGLHDRDLLADHDGRRRA